MRITLAIALGLLLGASRCPLTSAGEPRPYTGAPASSYHDPGQAQSGYQDPYSGNYGFSDGAPYAGDAHYSTDCTSCGGSACGCCGHQRCGLAHALWGGLPNPHKSTCDMPQHYQYFAEPKFYYYFRPYNWFHIPVQQDDVRAFGGDPRHPYDNRIFQSVYEQLHFNEPAPEQIVPPVAPVVPMSKANPSRDTRAAVENKRSNDAEKVVPAKATQRATESRTQVRIRRVSLADGQN